MADIFYDFRSPETLFEQSRCVINVYQTLGMSYDGAKNESLRDLHRIVNRLKKDIREKAEKIKKKHS